MSKRYVQSSVIASGQPQSQSQEAISVLLCGGLAGVATWVSIFPLGKTSASALLMREYAYWLS